MSRSYFCRWLLGAENFSGFSRNARQGSSRSFSSCYRSQTISPTLISHLSRSVCWTGPGICLFGNSTCCYQRHVVIKIILNLLKLNLPFRMVFFRLMSTFLGYLFVKRASTNYQILTCVPSKWRRWRTVSFEARGPFLECPDEFSGPELYFKIKIHRMVVQLLSCKPAWLVSSTYEFNAQFLKPTKTGIFEENLAVIK